MAAVRRSTARDEGWPGERIAGVTNHGDSVTVTWGDGRQSRHHGLWLRDNCACAECRDAETGQRLVDVSGLPLILGVSEAGAETELLRLTFAPEGHRGSIDAATLRARVPAKPAENPPTLWGRELGVRVPAGEPRRAAPLAIAGPHLRLRAAAWRAGEDRRSRTNRRAVRIRTRDQLRAHLRRGRQARP